MRRLLPEPSDHIDLVDAYAATTAGMGRPNVQVNMISSLDGVVSINGRAEELGGKADKSVFNTLRSLADIILVGAGTMRTEKYKPARMDDEQRKARRARGQTEVPAIAVVTRSAKFNWDSPFFRDAETRPIVITNKSGAESVKEDSELADVMVCGGEEVDLKRALNELFQQDAKVILCEGGPSLNAHLLEAQLVDEFCLTISPKVVGGSGKRIIDGPSLMNPTKFHLSQVLEDDGFLFLRLLYDRG